MKVILKTDVKGSGKKGDIIEVSDGYAKNFLLKKGLAQPATATGINDVEQRKNADAFHKAESVKAQKELREKIDGLTVPVSIRAGENGKVFGSVTTDKTHQERGRIRRGSAPHGGRRCQDQSRRLPPVKSQKLLPSALPMAFLFALFLRTSC